jgi:arsenite methyltransferase
MSTPQQSNSAVKVAEFAQPPWFTQLLQLRHSPVEGEGVTVHGIAMVMRSGILRSVATLSNNQKQTELTFGYKWRQRHTFERPEVVSHMLQWLIERYGDTKRWIMEHGAHPVLLDAGCGAGRAGLELFKDSMERIRYIGVDVSSAVEVAATRFGERKLSGGFLQADLNQLPLPRGCVDIIFCEGVLHHTDSTEKAFHRLAVLLKPGGRFLLYVYRKKGPVREFTDDYVRDRLQHLSPEAAWQALVPLTKLGRVLGELDIEINVEDPIELLDIPAGKMNLQRFIYWHVFKAFYRPDMTLDEMNHVNFDWYAPRNAHRHTVEDVRNWCAEAGLSIERENVQEAGITIVARKADER